MKYLEYKKYDHATYTLPVWEGDTVYNETVMLVGKREVPLLYSADRIISVRSSDLKKEYTEGVDYTLKDGRLIFSEKSDAPCFTLEEYYPAVPEKGKYLNCNISGREHIFFSEGSTIFERQLHVTYTHSDKWDGFVPSRSEKLERFRQRALNGEELTVLFYGDSITTGLNSSGKVGCEPYAATWCDMLAESMRKAFNNERLNFVNTAVSGKNITWAADKLKERAVDVAPDLMIFAFGMNDGELEADVFIEKLEGVLREFSTACPDCDVAVVSTTLPNKEVKGFWGNQYLFEPKMVELCSGLEHTDVIPMSSMHKALLEKKRFFDMTGNNVNHPNDFLARIYAQTAIKTIIG